MSQTYVQPSKRLPDSRVQRSRLSHSGFFEDSEGILGSHQVQVITESRRHEESMVKGKKRIPGLNLKKKY